MPEATSPQVSLHELRRAHAAGETEAIYAWYTAGQLTEVLAGRDPGHAEPEREHAHDVGSADQGAQEAGAVGQLTEADLKSMTPEEIAAAHKEGRFDELLGVRPR